MKTERLEKLLDFVKLKHKGQVRKYTGEPYYNHCVEVAEIAINYVKGCYEIALCHDLFEDTDCNFDMLHKELVSIGYNTNEAYEICTGVLELTDKFTKEDYSYMNRKKRKNAEAIRLGSVSAKSQSVKYADLINNTESIVENDPKFAKTYLQEKMVMLSLMNNGDKYLYQKAVQSLSESLLKLNNPI